MSIVLDGTNGISDVDGSASTPAIRGTDANTGIFFPAADTIAFAEGGTESARLNADSQFVSAAGTASLPVLTTTGDLNTGTFYPAADTVAWTTAGTERARITSGGDLLVGTTTNANNSKARIVGTATAAAGTVSALELSLGGSGENGGQIALLNSFATATNPNKWLRVSNTGDLQVVNSAYNAVIMQVTNAGAAFKGDNTTTWSTVSDIRIKQNIRPISEAVNKICNLKPCHFEYKNDIGKVQTGFIAQEFEQIFPGHVTEIEAPMQFKEFLSSEDKKIKSLDPNIVPYLVAAIQELKSELDAAKARIAVLEAK